MICSKENCMGCGICYKLCPKNAIQMVEDEEGFKYPIIDKNKCINCKVCEKKCPINHFENKNTIPKDFYMCWSKDKNIVRSSSSGGIFYEIASKIIDDGGIAVGCELQGINARHIVITRKEELYRVQGSKYVQSEMCDILDTIKNYLSEGKKVFICACPCQIAALKNMFNNNDLLYTADLICHGVAPTKFFKKYIKELEEKYGKKIISYKFRNNKKEWRKYVVEYEFADGKTVQKLAMEDPYMACYLQCSIYRESCYNCHFTGFPRTGDITLGDFSGVTPVEAPKESRFNGISCCLINNKNGQELFEMIKDSIYYEQKNIDILLKTNKNIVNPSKRPLARNKILLDKNSIFKVQKKYCKFKPTSLIVNRFLSVDMQNKIRSGIKK